MFNFIPALPVGVFSKLGESVPGLLKFQKKIVVSRSSKIFSNSELLIVTFTFSNESEDE